MVQNYKVNIDLINNEVLYWPFTQGHKKPSKLNYNEICANPEFLNNFSGKDAYLIGTIFASRSLNKLKVKNVTTNYKYLTLISVMFTAVMIISNILSTKLISVCGFTVAGAMLVYPFSYIFDYIITDVYGYQNARRVLWSCIFALLLFDLCIYVVIKIPPSPFWEYQKELEDILGKMLRTCLSSTVCFSISFFLSSYIFQKSKVRSKGGLLFNRFLKALLVSEMLDTSLFCLLAFYGIWPLEEMAKYLLVSYFIKVSYEIFAYSIITKPLIELVKKIEKSDIVDWQTDYFPFTWEVNYTASNNIYRD